MNKAIYLIWRATILLTVLALTFFIFVYALRWVFADSLSDSLVVTSEISPVIVANKEEVKKESVVFVGDIMLARDVERRIPFLEEQNPFLFVKDLLGADVVVGNFEASVPAVHEPTPSMVMKFSVARENLQVLNKGNFTHLSLANNHALDYGKEGYSNTVYELTERGITVGGYPVGLSSSSITHFNINDKTFSIVSINATFGYPTEDVWLPYIESAALSGDVVVAYIHWGEEYITVHNTAQETFAKELIDNGVDLIVGHHPHVVQDIGVYKDRLIFYSLGNFVFDQYWDTEVSQGLALALSEDKNDWLISLYPVESHTTRIQPRQMEESERQDFLSALAARSDASLYEEITSGAIRLQF